MESLTNPVEVLPLFTPGMMGPSGAAEKALGMMTRGSDRTGRRCRARRNTMVLGLRCSCVPSADGAR